MADITFTYREIIFEWDTQKAATNLRKHGLSLESASEVFFDPMLVVVDDDELVGDELREKVIGMTREWRVILVVYVMRNDRIRLISAQDATSLERNYYEDR